MTAPNRMPINSLNTYKELNPGKELLQLDAFSKELTVVCVQEGWNKELSDTPRARGIRGSGGRHRKGSLFLADLSSRQPTENKELGILSGKGLISSQFVA